MQPPRITPAVSLLRTDLFRTMLRESTKGVYVTYTNTPADPRIDAVALDHLDACSGHLGCTYHYVVRTSGQIEIARNPLTIAARPRNQVTRLDHIVVGVVGGRSSEEEKNYELLDTVNEDQLDALEWLYQSLADALQVELEIDDRVTGRFEAHQERQAAKQRHTAERLLAERQREELLENLDELEDLEQG